MASPINTNILLMMLFCLAKLNALRLSESTALEEKRATLPDFFGGFFGGTDKGDAGLAACDIQYLYLVEAHSDGGDDPKAVGASADYIKVRNSGSACSLSGFEAQTPNSSLTSWPLSGNIGLNSNVVFERPSGSHFGLSKENGGKVRIVSSGGAGWKEFAVSPQPAGAFSATCYDPCPWNVRYCSGTAYDGCYCDATYSTADSAGCTSSGSANGDPHVTNILGQKMDVNKEGRLPLIKFPRHSEWPNTFVLMEGLIESYGNICAPKFITTINISGTWLSNKKLTFRSAAINSTLPFTVHVDGTDVWSLTDKCNPKAKCSLFKDKTISLKGSANVDNDRVTLTIFGPSEEAVQVTITHYTWQVMKKDTIFHYPHLDFKIANLSHVFAKHDLGGILGQPAEDFKDWIEKPEQCADRLKLVRLQGPQQRGSTMSAFS